jgi:hypothetical protein
MKMTRATLISCFLSNLITISLFTMCGCSSGPVPKWDGKIWAAKVKYSGLIFTKDDGTQEIIPVTDPRFNDFVAMTYGDFTKFLASYVQGCSKWRAGVPMMSGQEALHRFQLITQAWADDGEASK